MQIEYEAMFPRIDKTEMRQRLQKAGARLVKKECLQKRVVFLLPRGVTIKNGWLRVRDEQDKITMSLKSIGRAMKEQKEVCLQVDSFEKAKLFLTSLGCREKAYQENKRELWNLGDAEIVIDEWPFLEPLLEIEGKSEAAVKNAAKKLGMEYKEAVFYSADTLYSEKYGVTENKVNNHTPLIVFNMKNPFVKK